RLPCAVREPPPAPRVHRGPDRPPAGRPCGAGRRRGDRRVRRDARRRRPGRGPVRVAGAAGPPPGHRGGRAAPGPARRPARRPVRDRPAAAPASRGAASRRSRRASRLRVVLSSRHARGGAEEDAMSETADVVVIGGGVMGTSIGFHLARRRAGRVILLEKNTVCSGTSAKSSAIVRTHYTTQTTAAMALLARRVFEHWAEEVGGESGFTQTGMLFLAAPARRASVERTLRMNQALGIEASLIGPAEVRALSPHVEVPEGAVVVWEPRSGYASPHDVAQ